MDKAQESVLLQILNTTAILCTALSGLDELVEIRDDLRSQADLCRNMIRAHLEHLRNNGST